MMRVIKDNIEEIIVILIFIAIIASLVAFCVISGSISDKKTMAQLLEHNEECSGHIHLIAATRSCYYYECDECYRTFRFYKLLK